MSLSVSIVVYSKDHPRTASSEYLILKDLLCCLCQSSIVKSIFIADNSSSPYFHALSETCSKIIYYHCNSNIGFGKAHNLAAKFCLPCDYHLILNPDIIINDGCLLDKLFAYMEVNSRVSLIQPLIKSSSGNKVQYLCKKNPTLFAQFYRGFVPLRFQFLFKSYNDWYEMRRIAYSTKSVESEYLSGCFMFCRRSSLDHVGWFDPRFFMYLEDADLTRRLSKVGQCLHNPNFEVRHVWARGSHSNIKLRIIAICSFIIYSFIWGLKFV